MHSLAQPYMTELARLAEAIADSSCPAIAQHDLLVELNAMVEHHKARRLRLRTPLALRRWSLSA